MIYQGTSELSGHVTCFQNFPERQDSHWPAHSPSTSPHLRLQLSGGLPSSARLSARGVQLALRERRRRSGAHLRILQLRVRAGQLGARGARGGLRGCAPGCLLIQAAPACCSNAMLCVYA